MPLVIGWIVAFAISILFGNISYEVFVAALGDHFYRFADQNQTILDGHSVQYVFQQRMLPSYEINVLQRVFKIDNMAANLVFYRSFFVLSSLLASAMSAVAGAGPRRTLLLTAIFSVSNVFIIVSGYWLMAFDLQNLVCVQVLFILFIVRMPSGLRIALLCVLAAVWQFTLEEVIYVPIFWLLCRNARALLALEAGAILKSAVNWLVAATIPASMVLTNLTRKWLLVGVDVRGSNTQVMAQDLQIETNLSTLLKQIGAVFHPLHTLKEDYWMQGVGLFLALNICAVCLVPSWSAIRRNPFGLAVLLMFVCMSSVSLLFAHLEETNTMMPLLANLMAIYLGHHLLGTRDAAAMDRSDNALGPSHRGLVEPERAA